MADFLGGLILELIVWLIEGFVRLLQTASSSKKLVRPRRRLRSYGSKRRPVPTHRPYGSPGADVPTEDYRLRQSALEPERGAGDLGNEHQEAVIETDAPAESPEPADPLADPRGARPASGAALGGYALAGATGGLIGGLLTLEVIKPGLGSGWTAFVVCQAVVIASIVGTVIGLAIRLRAPGNPIASTFEAGALISFFAGLPTGAILTLFTASAG
jgi:hypothetical protein